MLDYMTKLNDSQLEAVKTVEGPVLVFAGAGTGKTRTLTSRITYMIKECGIAPYNILAITFTKKATNEMRERIEASVGELARFVGISTIHALCAKILRQTIHVVGYSNNFEIIDDEDSLKIIHDIYRTENIERKYFSPKAAMNAISAYKNGISKLFGISEKIYNAYQEHLKKNNLVDFDDLLILTHKILLENVEIRKHYQDKYRYILVDEFQDTNALQYEIVKLLAGDAQNVFAVGDDDQSIYSFRGARVDNMYLFLEEFKKVKKIILNKNYRSTNAILKGANSVIANNQMREDKKLISDIEGTYNDVTVNESYYYEDEARYVSNEIRKLVKDRYDYKDIAVLYRNNVVARNFELAFIENHIPYVIYGGVSYLRRREIKDVVSYLKFIIDNDNMIHFKRIINQPSRGIGEKTIQKVDDCMKQKNICLFDAIEEVHKENSSSKSLALVEFKKTILELQALIDTMPLEEFFDIMIDKTGYLEMIQNEDNQETNREANLKEFKSILYKIERSFEDEDLKHSEKLKRGFDDIVLDESIGTKQNHNCVVLSTIHSIKGLEFSVVFVTALEEGIFPALREEADLEEERRVAYVAFTRAKERIYLTCATRRLIYGRIVKNMKSRFLTEYISSKELTDHIEEQMQRHPGTPGEIKVGDRVYHSNFGEGIVITIDDMTIQILFDKDHSLRKILKNHPSITKY